MSNYLFGAILYFQLKIVGASYTLNGAFLIPLAHVTVTTLFHSSNTRFTPV